MSSFSPVFPLAFPSIGRLSFVRSGSPGDASGNVIRSAHQGAAHPVVKHDAGLATAKGEHGPQENRGGSSDSRASKQPQNEMDLKNIGLQLSLSLLELGLTLVASYYFSRWIAKRIQNAGDSEEEVLSDMGVASEKGSSSVERLKQLLIARHEATLQAMAEELKHQQRMATSKLPPDKLTGDKAQQVLLEQQLQTQRQYSLLTQQLAQQHESSLSSLATLTPHESAIAQTNLIDPNHISVSFQDVGGMDQIKAEIYDLVVLPLLRPDLFLSDSGLVSPPQGILLYGPPGTGKTMLAKAIAKESHSTFLNVQLSTIMNKWFGESNKLVKATFCLARKLAPSVVFIDEMDAFLSQRDGTEGSAVNSMKSEFLTLWDGLLSGSGTTAIRNTVDTPQAPPPLPAPPIIVLGATNRPFDVDPAILRRLPRSFEIALPDYSSRLQLLRLFLKKQSMTDEAKENLTKVAQWTEGYSGSDLKEVCRAAAWEPIRELTSGASQWAVGIRTDNNNSNDTADPNTGSLPSSSSMNGRKFPTRGTKARPVNSNDFLIALQKVKKTGESARAFHIKETTRGQNNPIDFNSLPKYSDKNNLRDPPLDKTKNTIHSNSNRSRKTTSRHTPSPFAPQPPIAPMSSQDALRQMMALAMTAAASIDPMTFSTNNLHGNTNGMNYGENPNGKGVYHDDSAHENNSDDEPPELLPDIDSN